MLTVFRRLIYSKLGAVVAFLLFGIFALAMVGGDVSSLRTQGLAAIGGGAGSDAIRVGKQRVTPEELARRVQQEFEGFRQQQPTLTIQQYIAGGGLDATVQRLVNGMALDQFGRDQGMLVSKRAIDGQIASIPGLQGPNGEFDQAAFRQLLAERKLTERSVRDDLSRGILATQLTVAIERSQAPVALQLALPYANLSLERRTGTIAFVPTKAMLGGPAPTDAELQAFYGRNLARYTVPERRVVRYAAITPASVRAAATPSDADIARQYQADATKYAATEKRSITQVVVLDQGVATALAAKVKGGVALEAAATAAGLTASPAAGLTKATASSQFSPALADAVFGARQGGLVGPVRGGIGFVVARVDKIEQVAGKSLAQAHDEIVAALTARRTTDAVNRLHDQIDDALTGSATFDEIARDRGLSAQTSAPLLPNGANPDSAGPPDAALAPVVAAAFQMQDGDEPQMVQTGADGSFALVALGRIVAAAPRPLAQIREAVARDFVGRAWPPGGVAGRQPDSRTRRWRHERGAGLGAGGHRQRGAKAARRQPRRGRSRGGAGEGAAGADVRDGTQHRQAARGARRRRLGGGSARSYPAGRRQPRHRPHYRDPPGVRPADRPRICRAVRPRRARGGGRVDQPGGAREGQGAAAGRHGAIAPPILAAPDYRTAAIAALAAGQPALLWRRQVADTETPGRRCAQADRAGPRRLPARIGRGRGDARTPQPDRPRPRSRFSRRRATSRRDQPPLGHRPRRLRARRSDARRAPRARRRMPRRGARRTAARARLSGRLFRL